MHDENTRYQSIGHPNQEMYYSQQSSPQHQYYQYPAPESYGYLHGWVNYKNPAWVKGAVVGAAAAVIVANPTVRKAIVKGIAGIWGTLQGGVEELKEQIRDVQAEKGEEKNG